MMYRPIVIHNGALMMYRPIVIHNGAFLNKSLFKGLRRFMKNGEKNDDVQVTVI
jgi:hypothetical protein